MTMAHSPPREHGNARSGRRVKPKSSEGAIETGDVPMAALLQAAWTGLTGVDVAIATYASRAQIARLQRQRLAALLDWACRSSPLYRQRRAGRFADMEPVGKAELMRRHDEWVTDPSLDWDALQRFVADPSRIGQQFVDRYLAWTSSGSSGTPGVFVQDAQALAVYDALEAVRRPLLAADTDGFAWPAARFAFVGATGGHFASVVQVERVRRLFPQFASALQSFSFLQPRTRLCEALERFQPDMLATYPTMAVLLADAVSSGHLGIRLRRVLTGGETLTPAVRRRLVEHFGCRVANSYGASEFIALAFECGHDQLHLNADWVVLEPVDERLAPVPEDQFGHTTLLTNLANFTQPLIRYDLGDRVRIRSEPCICGSALPVVDVEGRSDQLLQFNDDRHAAVRIAPLALATVLEDEAGVHDYRVEQTDCSTLHLGVERRGTAGRRALASAQQALRRFLDSQGLQSVRLHCSCGIELPRSSAGKQQRIASRRPTVPR